MTHQRIYKWQKILLVGEKLSPTGAEHTRRSRKPWCFAKANYKQVVAGAELQESQTRSAQFINASIQLPKKKKKSTFHNITESFRLADKNQVISNP